MNFTQGTQLAILQDTLKDAYINNLPIDSDQLQTLKDNLWVKIAYYLAPSNLVIRQLCLIDLLQGYPTNNKKIIKLLNIITYNSPNLKIWAEGYSYFMYTLDILTIWNNKFQDVNVSNIIKSVIEGFKATSYLKDGKLYPATFGDVGEAPMNETGEYRLYTLTIGNLKVERYETVVVYDLKAKPLGFNTHIPKDNSLTFINNGYTNFKFYKGYSKKYESKLLEWFDTFHPKRVLSLFRLWKLHRH